MEIPCINKVILSYLSYLTAANTAKAIFAISTAPSVARAAMIMALTFAAVFTQSHFDISLYRLLMMVHSNPAA